MNLLKPEYIKDAYLYGNALDICIIVVMEYENVSHSGIDHAKCMYDGGYNNALQKIVSTNAHNKKWTR